MSLFDNGNGNGGMQRLAESALLKASARILGVVGPPVIAGVLVFYMQSGASEREKINDTLNKLNATVAVLQDRTGNLYSREQAKADFQLRDDEIGDLRTDLTAVGTRVDSEDHRIEVLEALRARYPHPR